jgi:hypothetical protein
MWVSLDRRGVPRVSEWECWEQVDEREPVGFTGFHVMGEHALQVQYPADLVASSLGDDLRACCDLEG